MKISVFIWLLLLTFQVIPQINQGDVLINSFDAIIDGDYRKEMAVLVNYTSSPIDLNGYEIRCYKYDAFEQPFYWQFTETYILPPYGFLLITNNIASVNGVAADIARTDIPTQGRIDHDGYLTFRKIGASNPSEYIDIVKYSRFTYPPADQYMFTDVPLNSGIDLTMPGVAFPFNSDYLTRGGVSGNLGSLTYTGYGMVGQTSSDFFDVPDTDITYIQNSSSPPLPVELSGFSAVVSSEKEVMLKWRTETEVSNYGFEIQRKVFVDNEWRRIGFVAGNGNSNSPKDYSFTDSNPVNGGRFNYRLKQIDTDGKYEFSNVIEVEIVPDEFVLYQNYPNPFNPSTVIAFSLPVDASNVKLSIYNELGEKVTDLVNNALSAGQYQYTWNAENMASEMYIYELRTDNFVSTRKMLLMK